MATAISGSGPAFFFLLMESMTDAGVHMGFSRDVARKLVAQTALGAAVHAQVNDSSPVTGLRGDITSPAGTTASAVYSLDRGNFRTTVSDAAWAAYRRSLELGGYATDVGPDRSKTGP